MFSNVAYYSLICTFPFVYASVNVSVIYQRNCVVCVSLSFMSDSATSWIITPARLLCPWDSPGKNTGVGCHALLQGILLTQGSNPGVLHCRQILYHLSHQGTHLFIICLCLSVYLSVCLSIYPWREWKIVKKKNQEFPDSPGLVLEWVAISSSRGSS